MPLYEFECPNHGRFELLKSIYSSDIVWGDCLQCGVSSPRVVSLVTMRPDTLWAGHYIENYGYVTSSSKVAQLRKERRLVEIGDRADQEAAHKVAADARAAKQQQFRNETREFMAEQLDGSGLVDSDGNLRPEATKKLSEEKIMEPQPQQEKIAVDS